MTSPRSPRPRRGLLRADDGEDGVAMVLALLFLLLFGLAVPALLGFADTSFRAAASTRDLGNEQYAADAVVQAAIDTLQRDANLGKEGGPCPDHVAVLNGVDVLVRCTARPGSGAPGGGGATSATAPGAAIITTSTTAGVVQSSNAELRIGGSILSRSTISNSAAQARLVATRGDVVANGACAGTILAPTGTVTCDAPTPVVAPTYPSPMTSLPAVQAVPPCAGATIVLQPGRYVDAAALSAITGTGCAVRPVRFLPGTYYFDFANAGSHEWLVNDANKVVIAGTATAAGDNCDVESPAGAQFVFGGDSRLNVQSGSLFLCAPAFTDRQRIAIFGTDVGTTTNGSASFAPSTATNAGTTSFLPTPPLAGRVIDGTVVTATLPKDGNASLALAGLGASLPPGGVLTRATLVVAHQVDPGLGGNNFDTTITGRLVAGTASQAVALTRSKVLASQAVDVTAFLQADPNRLAVVAFEYGASSPSNKTGDARVDGIRLDLDWTVSGGTVQGGCIVKAPYSRADTTTCALLRTDGSNTNVEVHGTIYAPLAPIDLGMTNVSRQLVDRGIVARTLHLSITPASTYQGEMIHVPSIGPATAQPRNVQLVACIRSGTGCAKQAGGADDVRLRADVTFAPTAGALADIRSWVVVS